MLTPQQEALVKSDVENNATLYEGKTLAQWWAERNPGKIAEYYSQEASPAFYLWRSSLPVSEVLENLIADDWQAMDNLTVGQDRIWVNLKEVGSIKPSSAAHRAALTECWKGTAAKVAVKDRILDMGKRTANNIEKLLATGTGSQADPAVPSFEGVCSWPDINEAMGV